MLRYLLQVLFDKRLLLVSYAPPHASPLSPLVYILLKLDENLATSGEGNSGSQASDLVLILGDDISEDGVLSRWDLLWKLDILLDSHLALLEWTLEVDVGDSVAEIGSLSDDGDQAILDLQVHLGALLNVLVEVTRRSDGECATTAEAVSDLGV